MNAITLLLVLAAPGVDYGWKPGQDGRLEYIIQLQQPAVDALLGGSEISSDIHPDVVADVKRFLLRLDQNAIRAAGSASPGLSLNPGGAYSNTASAARPVAFGWQPGADGQLEYIIQLHPTAVDALLDGKEISSDIHRDVVGNIRRFVIRIGEGEAPRISVRGQPAPRVNSRFTSTGGAPPSGPLSLPPPPTMGGVPGARNAGTVAPGGAARDWRNSAPGANGAPGWDGWTNKDPAPGRAAERWNGEAPPVGDPRAGANSPAWPANTGRQGTAPPLLGDPAPRYTAPSQEAPNYQSDPDWSNPGGNPGAPWGSTRFASAEQPDTVPRSRGAAADENAGDAEPARRRSSSAARTTSDREDQAAVEAQLDEETHREKAKKAVGSLLKELLLFASLGVNVVAVVIARQYYLRYRLMVREIRHEETLVPE